METLHDSLVQATLENQEKRVLISEEKKQLHNVAVISAIESVFNNIVATFDKEAALKRARDGYHSYTVATWGTNEFVEHMDHRFPIQFLVFGPLRDTGNGQGAAYFDMMGTQSMLKLVSQYFAPLSVRFVRNIKSKLISLNVYWK